MCCFSLLCIAWVCTLSKFNFYLRATVRCLAVLSPSPTTYVLLHCVEIKMTTTRYRRWLRMTSRKLYWKQKVEKNWFMLLLLLLWVEQSRLTRIRSSLWFCCGILWVYSSSVVCHLCACVPISCFLDRQTIALFRIIRRRFVHITIFRAVVNHIKTRSPAVAKIADHTGCQWPSRLSKVDDFKVIWKLICDFLLVMNSNLGPISHRF